MDFLVSGCCLVPSSILAMVCTFAAKGILMAPLPRSLVALTSLLCGLYLVGLDFVKVPLFHRWLCQTN